MHKRMRENKKVFAPAGKQKLPAGQVGLSRRKVFVGLSGGVDSSVSAALLRKEGYDVTGVFIKVWQPPFLSCTSKEDRADAMRVAARLDIPFLTLDLSKEYKRDVVDYMLAEYRKGNTPNPDAMCNKEIKFGAFLAWALERGADFVATGHYAKNSFNKRTGRYELREGKDKGKDQSYFLWPLSQKELARTLFPVGNLEKQEVRALAKRFGLPTAAKKDSQGLCFVGKVDMKEFLSYLLQPKQGKVLDEKGNHIGAHGGALLYTFGERHGFTVLKKSSCQTPYYVIGKDMGKNTITVSASPQRETKAAAFVKAAQANFISKMPQKGEKCLARFRYRQTPVACEVRSASPRHISIRLGAPDYTISRGQSLVLYAGDKCLGGGVIA